MLILRFNGLLSSAYQWKPHSFQSKPGNRTNFSLIDSMRFSSGNQPSIAAPSEHDHQQTGIGIDSEDEFASLASSRKNASHATRHELCARFKMTPTLCKLPTIWR